MNDIKLKKPVSLLNRNVKIDLKELFTSLAKKSLSAKAQILTGDVGGLVETAIDGFLDLPASIKLEELQDEELSWVLIVTSLSKALQSQMEKDEDLFNINPNLSEDTELIKDELIDSINQLEISINSDFFSSPQNLTIFDELEPFFAKWFEKLGLDKAVFLVVYERLKSEFVSELHKEWVKNGSKYKSIINNFDSPFVKADSNERKLAQYRLWLKQQVNERLFEEAFGLEQIYIPLRGYYVTEIDSLIQLEGEILDEVGQTENKHIPNQDSRNNKKLIACKVYDEICEWVDNYDEEDTIRVISGGPGSGKSSFSKMLAYELSKSSNHTVIFIPLHRFKLDAYLVTAVENFLNTTSILNGASIVSKEANRKNVLFIFDGLDELTMQGGSNVKQVADDFVGELRNTLRDHKEQKWQAIISGRELAIQSQKTNFRKHKSVLHLLPYYLNEEEKEEYIDEQNILDEDQRDTWWKKYSELKGLGFSEMPKDLKNEHLEPITKEPLLNYLVSLSYQRNEVKFDDNTNLNDVYYDLLTSVFERKYSQSGQHITTKDIEQSKFVRLLEEVALAVWHQNGRTASVEQITNQCKKSGVHKFFNDFEKDAKSGVTKLLLAFYFREFQNENSKSDKTFEFTHKSFGEYLTARRIVSALKTMVKQLDLSEKTIDEGWSIEEIYKRWLELCGPQEIDGHLIEFIKGEMSSIIENENGLETIKLIQKLMINLLELAIDDRSPVKKLNLEFFKEDLLNTSIAEFAMLQIHSICAYKTNEIILKANLSKLDKWLNRIGKRIRVPLNHLNLTNIKFHYSLVSCDFTRTKLNHVKFEFLNIFNIDFNQTEMEDVEFFGVKLLLCDFRDCLGENLEFSHCHIEIANYFDFKHKILNFVNVFAKRCDKFDFSKVEKLSFRNSVLQNVKINVNTNAEINFSECLIEGCKLNNVDINKLDIIDSQIIDNFVEDENFKSKTFINTKFYEGIDKKRNANLLENPN